MRIPSDILTDSAVWEWADLDNGRYSLRCLNAATFAAIDAGAQAWPSDAEVSAAFGVAVAFSDGGDDTTEAIYYAI